MQAKLLITNSHKIFNPHPNPLKQNKATTSQHECCVPSAPPLSPESTQRTIVVNRALEFT